jgi:uncharacterized protein YihD (DUF1040 family)
MSLKVTDFEEWFYSEAVKTVQRKRKRMRDPARIYKMVDMIAKAWHKHPELRLCQILSTALSDHMPPGKDDVVRDMFYVEDDVLKESIERFFNDLESQNS